MSTYSPIASQTLTSNTSSITFSNLPTNYTDLILVINPVNGSTSNLRLRFNADTGSNYGSTFLYGFGTSTYSDRQTNETYIIVGAMYNDWASTVINIQNYNSSVMNKTTLTRTGQASNGTGVLAGVWRNTSPITSINITDAQGFSLWTGSTLSLYGIATGSPKASGGNIVTTDGTYWYHTFLSSGIFNPNQSLTADYLVVAGGGGGGGAGTGYGGMGGGGAGGFRTATSQSLTTTAYTVTIGAGGAGGSYTAAKGSNSVFSTFTSTGGGRGGGGVGNLTGGTGGSGGGSADGFALGSGNEGAFSPAEGYNGGLGSGSGSSYGGGGGGGASANGGAGTSTSGGAGGNGTANSYSGTSVTYAGGGGGGVGYSLGSGPGAGGAGGGGAGASPSGNGIAGTANTGGGGGGAGGPTASIGGNGGSGVVIIRYAV